MVSENHEQSSDMVTKITNLLRELSTSASGTTTIAIPGTSDPASAAEIGASSRLETGSLAKPCKQSLKHSPAHEAVPVSTKRSFMDLPAELQNMIYKHALVLDHPIDLWPAVRGSGPDRQGNASSVQRAKNLQEVAKTLSVGLLRVSRQINQITSPMFYGLNTFQFTNRHGWIVLEAFLYTIGLTNRKNVINLAVCYPSRGAFPLRRYLERVCVILLNMHLHAPSHDNKFGSRTVSSQNLPLDWDDLAIDDSLLVLSKYRSLKKLSILCQSWDVESGDSESLAFLEELAAAFPNLQMSLHVRVRRMHDDTDEEFVDRTEHEWARIQTVPRIRQVLQKGWIILFDVVDDRKKKAGLIERRDLVLV